MPSVCSRARVTGFELWLASEPELVLPSSTTRPSPPSPLRARLAMSANPPVKLTVDDITFLASVVPGFEDASLALPCSAGSPKQCELELSGADRSTSPLPSSLPTLSRTHPHSSVR